ncbi:MAG: tRNA (adenosine(37)-N6)-threonylcarbamoyltransferase complex transferase subunit TsaD [Chitinophagales bacterium]
MTKLPTLLAIESSCEDTSAAVIKEGKVLSNIVANQDVHKEWGGVVPELASRAHQQHIVPVVAQALKKAGITKKDLDGVAFTRGPGLIGSLMVGTSFAKGLSLGLKIPMITVNHMQAHVLAHFIEDPKPQFPFLCLTVSGGHTQIVRVASPMDMQVVGETLDDAAGEAFDKTAKIMGLPYPGGPLVDKYAQQGNPKAYKFPQPKSKGSFNFSFSGLKTAILYFLQREMEKDEKFIEKNLNDICASVQYTIVTILLKRLEKAAKHFRITEIAIAGGVSANSELRKSLVELGEQKGWNTYIPQFQYCTDNAAMIAMTAHYQYLEGDFADQSVTPLARFKI